MSTIPLRAALLPATLVLLAALLTGVPAAAAPADTARFASRPAAVERDFVQVSYGQIHLRRSVSADDTVSRKTPVMLFHQSPNSSQVFVEFMAELGADRAVFTPDTPGFGNSDLPSRQPTVTDYALAMSELADALGLQRVQLVGYHTGAAIAIELARKRPELVTALVLVGIPVFELEEQAAFRAQPWPTPRAADGSHVQEEWQRSMLWRGPGQSEDSVARTFTAKMAAGQTAWWGAHAAIHYETRAALSEITAPVLFIRPRDDLWESSLRALPALGDAPRIDLPEHGFGLFETIPERLAETVRVFFDDGGVQVP